MAAIGVAWAPTGIVEDALKKEVERLEAEHGGPFPESDTKSKLRETGKEPLVIRMPEDVMDRLRRAASHLETTAASLANAGVERELKEMESTFNKGKRFPQRPKENQLPPPRSSPLTISWPRSPTPPWSRWPSPSLTMASLSR